MLTLRIAGAQIPVGADIAANTQRVLWALERARGEGADILLTPEGSLSGYTHVFDQGQAERALEAVRAEAARWGIALALGTCRVEADGICYDQVRFYDSSGGCLGYQAKTLLTGTMTDPPRGELEHFGVGPLRVFTVKGIRVGGLVCNDLWANPECTPQPDPHLSHSLALQGARIILHSVNGARDASSMSQGVIRNFHESNLRMRARADGLYIATVDNAFPLEIGTSSPGGIVGPDGGWLAQAPARGEHVFVASIELNDKGRA